MRFAKELGIAVLGILAPIFVIWVIFKHDFIVVNNMNSVPRGWWARTAGTPTYGDVILFDVPQGVQGWILHKDADGNYMYPKAVHWLRTGGRILKPVSGIHGDTLCRDSTGAVSINDVNLGNAPSVDKNGIQLPLWSGCHILDDGEYAVISQTPDSLDSRVFGFVSAKDVVGRYKLLWEFR